MAIYTIPAGAIAVHDKTLGAAVVDVINFTIDPPAVEIETNGTAAIYVTTDGSAPTVGGTNTRVIPATAGRRVIAHGGNHALRLISAGTPTYSVTIASREALGSRALADQVDSLESSRGAADGIATLDGDGQVPADQLGNATGGGSSPTVTLIADFGTGASAESGIEPRVIDFGTWLRLSGRVRIVPESPVAVFDEPMFVLPEGITRAAYETRAFLVYQYDLDGGG